MSIGLVRQQIAAVGVAVVERTRRDYVTKKMVASSVNMDHPRITEVTDTHVIGHWIPAYYSLDEVPDEEPCTLLYYKLNPKLLENTPFKVKHNGVKFAFGGGSSSGTRNYYFKNIRQIA